MKQHFSVLVLILIITCCVSCASHRHSRAYLLQRDPKASNDVYSFANGNTIEVAKDDPLKIEIEEIRLGYLHQNRSTGVRTRDSFPWIRAFQNHRHDGQGGKEVWVIVDAISTDPADTFQSKSKRIVVATNVKLDQESFSFLPLNERERLILNEPGESGYQVAIRIYLVYGFDLKKAVAQASQKSLGKWATESVKMILENTSNLIAKEFIDQLGDRTNTPYFYERMLLSAGAELQFEGNFEVIRTKEPSKEQKYDFALYDFVKSEIDPMGKGDPLKTGDLPDISAEMSANLKNFASLWSNETGNDKDKAKRLKKEIVGMSPGINDYSAAYVFIHSAGTKGTVTLPSASSVQKLFATPGTNHFPSINEHLRKSYVKLKVNSKRNPPLTWETIYRVLSK